MSKKVHIMFDLETFGIKPDAMVISIGAVVFNPIEGTVLEDDDKSFYTAIDICQAMRTIEPETVKFWIEQTMKKNPPDLSGTLSTSEAFYEFYKFLEKVCPDKNNLIIWAKGIDFDIPKCYIKPPWLYSNVRDARTVIKLFGRKEHKPTPPEVTHNALNDAIYQAQWVANILSSIMEEVVGD